MEYITDMNQAYRGLLEELYDGGIEEQNARTGTRIKTLSGAHSFKLSLVNGRLPVPGNRAYFPHVAAAETAWQFMGTKDPTFMLRHAPKLWEKFLEKELMVSDFGEIDGETDVIKAAYGYRWRKHFGRDQIENLVRGLTDDPTNRQLYVSAWDPARDGLGGPDQPKNIPCPVGFSVTCVNDALHMSVFIRSSDVYVGLPYDVMSYALTLDAIAATVGKRPSSLHFTLAHPHVYEPHFGMLKANITGLQGCSYREARDYGFKDQEDGDRTVWCNDVEPHMPGWPISRILGDPDGYVDQVKILSKRAGRNEWNPKPLVVV